MKMLKNLFASLLFAVLTFTATAQVTHTITFGVGSSTVNVTAAVGDILHFNTIGGALNMLMVWKPTFTGITIPATLTTGIESIKHTTTKLSVFPNPSTDEVSVIFNTNKEKTTIEVFDIEGRLVMTDEATREIGQNTVKINVSNFSQGIYIVRAGTETFKITKI